MGLGCVIPECRAVSGRGAVEGNRGLHEPTPNAAMDKNTNLTNPVVAAVTRPDAAASVKKPAGAPGAAPGQQPPPLPNFAVLARRIFGNWPLIVIAVIIGIPISFKVARAKRVFYRSEGA